MLLLKTWIRKGFPIVQRSNKVTLNEERYSWRPLSEKPKFSKMAIHQAAARFKTFGSFQSWAGLVGSSLPVKEMISRFDQICCSQVQMSVHLPWNVVSVINLCSERTNLPENVGLHLPWKLREIVMQSLTSIGPFKSGGRWYRWIAVLTEFQFFRYLPFWVHLFMHRSNVWPVHSW